MKKLKVQKGKYYKPPTGEEEVEAGDPGSKGDKTPSADDNHLYPQASFHLVCTVLLNMSNTVG